MARWCSHPPETSWDWIGKQWLPTMREAAHSVHFVTLSPFPCLSLQRSPVCFVPPFLPSPCMQKHNIAQIWSSSWPVYHLQHHLGTQMDLLTHPDHHGSPQTFLTFPSPPSLLSSLFSCPLPHHFPALTPSPQFSRVDPSSSSSTCSLKWAVPCKNQHDLGKNRKPMKYGHQR